LGTQLLGRRGNIVKWQASPGINYYVFVTGEDIYYEQLGLFELTVKILNLPDNDDCQGTIPLVYHIMSVYSGSCVNLTCMDYSQYNPRCDGNWEGGTVSWEAEADVDYYILVRGYGAGGSFELTLSEVNPPENNECLDAIAVQPSDKVFQGSTLEVVPVVSSLWRQRWTNILRLEWETTFLGSDSK
jgi:hypothetical protein